MEETIYFAKVNAGQGDNEYASTSPSLDQLVREAEDKEGEAVEVGEYKLVRAFKAKRTTTITEI